MPVSPDHAQNIMDILKTPAARELFAGSAPNKEFYKLYQQYCPVKSQLSHHSFGRFLSSQGIVSKSARNKATGEVYSTYTPATSRTIKANERLEYREIKRPKRIPCPDCTECPTCNDKRFVTV